MNKSKKIISLVAAAALTLSTVALASCADKGGYKGEALSAGYDSAASVSSNGGFVVEKGNYVYFINGKENSTADNTYGKPVKGALMRISKEQLASGKYDEAQIVVPSLFVSGNYDSGIYIYGDYVYYATPTTDKNNDGQIENSYLDFKRAKLDGSQAPMDGKKGHLFRLSSNSAKYRFVEVNETKTVYCLYEEDSKLKSYNVSTGKTHVLVSGASSFIYDTKDLTNPNVYYTMGVTYDVEQDNPTTASGYNQIYCVNAAATATVDKATASYKVFEGETQIASYDFDEKAMKDNAEEKEYDLGDYSTYPYVNLGKLVLDGVDNQPKQTADTRFHNGDVSKSTTLSGYTYTLQQQGNGGIYFTRTEGTTDSQAAYLRYLANDAEGDSVTKNGKAQTVAQESTNASAAAIYQVNEGVHSYFYLAETKLKKVTAKADGSVDESKSFTLANDIASGSTLWKTDGDYLYYYGTGTNGKSLSRINYTGTEENYIKISATHSEEYDPLTLSLVDWSDGWYKPELVTAGTQQFAFYPNAQSYGNGATAYDYVYVAKLGTTEEIIARNEQVEEVNEFIGEYSDNSQIQTVMKYYFRTGETSAYDAVKDLYTTKQQEYFDEFKAKFSGENAFQYESEYISLLGRMIDEDKEEITEAWQNSLLKETEETEEKEGLPTWAIVLIVCGSVLVVGAAAIIPTAIVLHNKKVKKQREEAIVSAYKHKKIDTTDDKSIDVYAEETEGEEEEKPADQE